MTRRGVVTRRDVVTGRSGVTGRGASRGPCFAGRPYVDPGAAGPLCEPGRPMFVFDRKLAMLERAFYRHLLRAIDLDALFDLEQLLWAELQEREVFTDDQVLDLSNAILARALDRLAHEPLRSMKPATVRPDGEVIEVPEEPHGTCPFCPMPAGEAAS